MWIVSLPRSVIQFISRWGRFYGSTAGASVPGTNNNQVNCAISLFYFILYQRLKNCIVIVLVQFSVGNSIWSWTVHLWVAKWHSATPESSSKYSERQKVKGFQAGAWLWYSFKTETATYSSLSTIRCLCIVTSPARLAIYYENYLNTTRRKKFPFSKSVALKAQHTAAQYT